MAKQHKVLITHLVERDLASILRHVALNSSTNALSLISRIEEKMWSLATLPHRGTEIPEAKKLGYPARHLIESGFRIIYEIRNEEIHVLRVVHGHRILKKSFLR